MSDAWFPDWRGRQSYWETPRWARIPEGDIAVGLFRWQREPDSNGSLGNFENRWFLLFRRIGEDHVTAIFTLGQTIITSSSGSTQTITSDITWSNWSSTVEAIGAGARGAHGASSSTSGGGAGGGAYTKILNMQFTTPGTTQAFVRVGGVTATDGTAGGDSWLTQTAPGTTFPAAAQIGLGAKGGAALVSATTATGGAGGAKASAYTSPSTGAVTASGGTGGTAGAANNAGGGGGGAGGAAADGANVTGTAPQAGTPGNGGLSGGGTAGPVGNGAPAAGGAGINISRSVGGSGGGGGGGNASGSTGGAGGNYGAGGGGGGNTTGIGGQGAQGIVVLTWTPFWFEFGQSIPAMLTPRGGGGSPT